MQTHASPTHSCTARQHTPDLTRGTFTYCPKAPSCVLHRAHSIINQTAARATGTHTHTHSPVVHTTQLRIDLCIRAVAAIVFENIFHGGRSEHKQEREVANLFPKRLHLWDKVEEGYKEEENVGKSVELLP